MPPKRKAATAAKAVAPKKAKRPAPVDWKKIDAIRRQRESAMKQAVEAGDLKQIDKLISADKDKKEKEQYRKEAFFLALKHGPQEVALHLVSKHNRQPDEGLRYSCYIGNMPMVLLMLSKGATKLDHGLHEACWSANLEIAELMISKGANFDDGDDDRWNYDGWNRGLQGACYSGSLEIAEIAISKGANDWNRGLRLAAEGQVQTRRIKMTEGHLPLIHLMISKGANDWTGAAKTAAEFRHPQTTALLLSKGADPTIVFDGTRNADGRPAGRCLLCQDDGDDANPDCEICADKNCDADFMFELLTTTSVRRSMVSNVIGVESVFVRLDGLVGRTNAALVTAAMPAVLRQIVVEYCCAV
jgi:ankyrin repeat protein